MITSFYAGLAGLILIFLSVKIIQARRFFKIAVGDEGNNFLQRKIRAHGNFIEYSVIFLIMLFFAETEKLDKNFVHLLGVAFIIGRILHAYGIIASEVKNKNFFYRQAGMFCTFFCLFYLSLFLIFQFIKTL